jgi:hypothetical protein
MCGKYWKKDFSMAKLELIPQPASCKLAPGAFGLPETAWIFLEDSPAARDWFAAERLARRLETATHRPWKIARFGGGQTPRQPGIVCLHDDAVTHDQGYRLTISPRGVTLRARTAAGMFYAMQTLAQIARTNPARWPALAIVDAPDFQRRGFYHDISRGKVPELGTILQLVDDLASLKINEFQLYIENVFEFRQHPQMYEDTTPLTAEELLLIDEACRRRHIDFIPSLTSLGHFEKILRRPAYRALAEAEPEELRKQGIQPWTNEPWSLCVTDPKAKALLQDMYDEFLPNFRSPLANICCDESWDLGKGRSKALAGEIGVAQLYVDWINYCAQLASRHGKRIMLWGDIIRDHPEKLPQLPADATLIEWGYEANHDFLNRGQIFADSERPFYMAPGTSSWQTLAGRSANALGNILSGAIAGKKHGAAGLLNTDWGDNGHQQLLSISLLPMVYGAAVSWRVPQGAASAKTGAVPDLKEFLHAASIQFFGDATGTVGTLIYDLGQTYTRLGHQRFNAAVEFFLFREAWDNYHDAAKVSEAGLHKTRARIEKTAAQLERVAMTHPDGALINRELRFTALLMAHTIDRTLVRRQIIGRKKRVPAATLRTLAKAAEHLGGIYEHLWLARNKRSRLDDVLPHFARLAREYRAAAR